MHCVSIERKVDKQTDVMLNLKSQEYQRRITEWQKSALTMIHTVVQYSYSRKNSVRQRKIKNLALRSEITRELSDKTDNIVVSKLRRIYIKDSNAHCSNDIIELILKWSERVKFVNMIQAKVEERKCHSAQLTCSNHCLWPLKIINLIGNDLLNFLL